MIVIDGKSAVSHIDTLKLQIISVTNCRFSQAIAEKTFTNRLFSVPQ